jgi:hypothetical protein
MGREDAVIWAPPGTSGHHRGRALPVGLCERQGLVSRQEPDRGIGQVAVADGRN